MIRLCRGEWAQAREVLGEATRVFAASRQGNSDPAWFEYIALSILGQAYLGAGEPGAAFERFREALACCGVGGAWPLFVVALLDGLEGTSPDPATFRDLCDRFQEAIPPVRGLSLASLYLEAAQVAVLPAATVVDDFAALSPAWTRHDVFGDCAFEVHEGLEIRAAPGRDLQAHVQRAFEDGDGLRQSCGCRRGLLEQTHVSQSAVDNAGGRTHPEGPTVG